MTTSTNAPDGSALPYASANLDVLSAIFAPYPTLSSFINWRPQWSEQKQKMLKRPIQNIASPASHLTLQRAAYNSSYIGLVCSPIHSLIALDIDGVPSDHPTIKTLLHKYPTYTELSPSGKPNHLRLIYELPSLEDKQLLASKASFTPPNQANSIELFNSSTNFVTLTGQATPSPTPIASIHPDHLLSLFPEFAPAKPPALSEETALPVASLVSPDTWLQEVPCDRADPDLQHFLGKHAMTYHDYWLFGIMSIHAAFGSMRGFGVADQWSQRAGDEYDENELQQRWRSFSIPDYTFPTEHLPTVLSRQPITAATYQWMFNEFSIQWPMTKGKTKIPKPDEFKNFIAFLEYKGLTISQDSLTHIIYLEGEDHAVYPTYYQDKQAAHAIDTDHVHQLAVKLVYEAMPYNFHPTTAQVINWVKDIAVANLHTVKHSRFAKEIMSKPSYDPTQETDYLLEMATEIVQRDPTIEYPSQEFHNTLIRKWLLSLGRNLWPELIPSGQMSATSEGMLILSSVKGGIGKSSFGVRLFPPEWRHLHVSTKPLLSGKFVDKDSILKTIGKLIVDFDEGERVFNYNDTAEMKAYLTEQYDIIRRPYDRDMMKYQRNFSCMTSTNKTDLIMPNEGARRYWWTTVSYIDTYRMDTMDMYNLWRQIYYELQKAYGKRAPYLLTASEVAYLESYLGEHATENSVEVTLKDLYDFSDEGFKIYFNHDKRGKLVDQGCSLTMIHNIVAPHQPGVKMQALGHAVKTLLRKYAPPIYMGGKEITNGYHETRRQKLYFMPSLRQEALRRAADMDEEATYDN